MVAIVPERGPGVVPRRLQERRGFDEGTVVLVDPGMDGEPALTARLRERDVALHVYTDVLRALARLGAGDVDMLVLSAGLGTELLVMVVGAAREELDIPVVVAHGPGETDAIGPAVLAGARPLLTRPYAADAVVAALHEVRPVPPPPPVVHVGPLRLDASTLDVHLHGHGLDLSALEFALLHGLAVRTDHVVPHESLRRRLAPGSSDPEAVLVAAVSRLRRKLERYGIDGAVHTVRGVGYRLDSDVIAAAVEPSSE
ncbi:winged helix-turn-helix domain-containing protein [Myceligenerans pegani]|uniref:Winged-helix domain-containing protein n=1 Tax=Myceligenerans pegani TaxID=2776917 RepID=A0ABR9N4H3_9MICO|nr:winged helix-turn-helix domain-containing protein [Myceligenerans sp. TRM 65318]MBE1878171.1 winged-helix domain-containing protein [Myceligenerans sp. TRM 65318]MBE3020442.1 winged-helix domain-containing protein [Myceligenerans sp. TRM 65318]